MTPETLERMEKICSAIERTAQMVQDETDAVFASGDVVEVIIHFDHARRFIERIKESREAIQKMVDLMSKEQVPDAIRASGQKPPITVVGVGRVSIGHRFSCSMLDKTAGLQWLRDNGQGGLIQETVNAQTLGSFAKGYIQDEGRELPDEIFKTGTQAYTSITKA